MPNLKPAADDLADRRPVWAALSDLFLDTDVSLSRPWRVAQLAQSPYAIEALELILTDEVYPVCKYNLWSVAGEWAGFDPSWLENQILRRLNARFRLLHRLGIGGSSAALRSSEWCATKEAIRAKRNEDPAAD